MAQMESKWIDNRSFEQITLETIPTGKYNDIFKMIKENPKPFSTEFILTDDEMSSARKEIVNLKKTIENLNVTIEKIKNPKKKDNDEADVSSMLEKLDAVIAEKQEALTSIKTLEQKLVFLQVERDYTAKKWISFNRLIKEYNKTKDDEYLEKGVHWICEYADKMIEREKKYILTHSDQV